MKTQFVALGLIVILMLAMPISAPNALQPHIAAQAQVEPDYGQLPLYFVENQGQMDEHVAYYLQGSDKTIYFAPDGVTFALTAPITPTLSQKERERNDEGRTFASRGESDPQSTILNPQSEMQRWAVKLDFVGANPNVHPLAQDKTEAVVSYFKGPQDQWHAGLPTYSRLVYPDLWPGIDLVYYGTVNRLKYEFVVKLGADPAQIQLVYRGATSVQVNAAGQLEVTTPLGGFSDDTPVAYQEVNGQRVPVSMAYQTTEVSGQPSAGTTSGVSASYSFAIGDYDPARPLILDPAVIVYCGYIGGSDNDDGDGIAVDSAGNAYVTGTTGSTQATFPVTGGPDLTHNGGYDAFVIKINATGTALVYAGYIGGSGNDHGDGIAVDGVGNAYITGYTQSTEATFPVTGGPDLTFNGGNGYGDAFVTKVNAAGTALIYAGYIGGVDNDRSGGIAVDSAGNAYVTGLTDSTEGTFPVTGGPDLTHNGGSDAFVAKVNAAGTTLIYAGYLGGSGSDAGNGIAVDGVGNAYITGNTTSRQATFPVTVGPDLTYNGGFSSNYGDAFVAKVNAAGTALVYAGYIGGSNIDYGFGIAVDNAGNAYVTGRTWSSEATFPATVGPDLTFNGTQDAFVAKVNTAGTALVYAGYIGGSSYDTGGSIAVDGAGNAYVTGDTLSTETSFPVSGGPDLTYNGGMYDAFVTKVNTAGTALVYAGYLGGSSNDQGLGIAVDGAGNAYITGDTLSTQATFPVTGGPDLTYNGNGLIYSGYSNGDAFVAKVSESGAMPTAQFSGNPLSGTMPLTVQFTDQSIGQITSWLWNFGDGSTSTSRNPSHIYTQPGTYTVALTVTGSSGSDTETKVNYIAVTPPTPHVIEVYPVSGESGVAHYPSPSIYAVFDMDMDTSSFTSSNMQVYEESQGLISGEVSAPSNKKIVFKPTDSLAPDTQYTVYLRNGIRAANGQMLAAYQWRLYYGAIQSHCTPRGDYTGHSGLGEQRKRAVNRRQTNSCASLRGLWRGMSVHVRYHGHAARIPRRTTTDGAKAITSH